MVRSHLLFWRFAMLAAWLVLTGCASAPPRLNDRATEGMRWGVYALDGSGRVLRAERETERFLPASTAKLFVTAAAFHYLGDLKTPDPALATEVYLLDRGAGRPPDLLLKGGGDPRLGAGPECVEVCLEDLADAVAASGKAPVIGDVIGEGSAFRDASWGSGWVWGDLQWHYGAPPSALSVNGNAVTIWLIPGPAEGTPVSATFAPGDEVFSISNQATTAPRGMPPALSVRRKPGRNLVEIGGSLPVGEPAFELRLAVDDPAEAAATRFSALLSTRGIAVTGMAQAASAPVDPEGPPLARLMPRPLVDTVRAVNLDSDNQAAEMLLMHIAAHAGGRPATPEAGLAAVRSMLAEAGLGSTEIDLADASGLSVYNRVTPKGMVTFLAWAADQPWSEAWRSTLPVGGESGTLLRRFGNGPLRGRITAKTGTLTGVNGLAGFIRSAEGDIVFAVYANDRPRNGPSILSRMDAYLEGLAGPR